MVSVLGKCEAKWSQGCKLCRNLTPIGGIMIFFKKVKINHVNNAINMKMV